MLLITYRSWVGPGRNYPEDRDRNWAGERIEAAVTRLPLGEAIDRMKIYRDAFNARSGLTAIEIAIIGVASIDELTSDQIEAGRLRFVETLPQSPDEID